MDAGRLQWVWIINALQNYCNYDQIKTNLVYIYNQNLIYAGLYCNRIVACKNRYVKTKITMEQKLKRLQVCKYVDSKR